MIKVYSAKITDFTQADYTKQYSLLNVALRQRIDNKKSENDKCRSIAGYILLYNGIAELFGINDINITFNKNGKPLLDFCFFSISHSEEMVVCAISDACIGVDIQKIKKISYRKEYKFFNEQENQYVNSDSLSLDDRFIEVFTKKEAAIKMLGGVLADSRRIDTFSNKFKFFVKSDDGFVTTICIQN